MGRVIRCWQKYMHAKANPFTNNTKWSAQACKPARGDETASLMGWEKKAHHGVLQKLEIVTY